VLVWLSDFSDVEMTCIWSSWCHYQPIISCFIKMRNGLTFVVPVYPRLCWKKRPLNGCLSFCLASLLFSHTSSFTQRDSLGHNYGRFLNQLSFLLPNQQCQSTDHWPQSNWPHPFFIHQATPERRDTVSLTLAFRNKQQRITTTVLRSLHRTICVSQHTKFKNWKILLEQSLTACMPLLTATSAFGLQRRCWSSPQLCYLHHHHSIKSIKWNWKFFEVTATQDMWDACITEINSISYSSLATVTESSTIDSAALPTTV